MSVVDGDRVGSERKGPSLRAAVVAAGGRWSAGQRQLLRLVPQLDASGEWVHRPARLRARTGWLLRSTSRCARSASGCASVARSPGSRRSTAPSTTEGCRTASCGRSPGSPTRRTKPSCAGSRSESPPVGCGTRSRRGSSGMRRRKTPKPGTTRRAASGGGPTSTGWARAASACRRATPDS